MFERGGGAGGSTRCDVVALGCQNGSVQVPFVVEWDGKGLGGLDALGRHGYRPSPGFRGVV